MMSWQHRGHEWMQATGIPVLLLLLLLLQMSAGWVLAAEGEPAGGDFRPAFDKGAHRQSAWVHANPWWHPDKDRRESLGGPDVAMRRYPSGAAMWREIALELEAYGVDGMQLESSVNAPYYGVFKAVLEGFKEAGNQRKVAFFLGMHGDNLAADTVKFFTTLHEELSHPNLYKVDGRPLVILYSGASHPPEKLQEVIAAVEEKFGPMLWLLDAMNAKPEVLRRYLPYLDGISMYANWGLGTQRQVFAGLVPVMRQEFPHKIFEAAVQNNYFNHYHYGGVSPRLMDKYLDSWACTLEAEPDSITMTNLFDHYENSHHLPSYNWEDMLFRIAQYHLAGWRGQPASRSPEQDIYTLNLTNVLIGRTAPFDLIAFPASNPTPRKVTLEICAADGELLHRFDPVEFSGAGMEVRRFDLDTWPLAEQMGLFPRLRYADGETTPLFPGTHLCTSVRPHMLSWARCNNHVIPVDDGSWELNGAGAGQFVSYPVGQAGFFRAWARPLGGSGVNRGGGHVRLLRNGREIETYSSWGLHFSRLVRLPDPGAGWDWYNLELENARGCRYMTAPIFVVGQQRSGRVRIPFLRSDDSVQELEVAAFRVPFFAYPCQQDTQGILRDVSGFEHHGRIGGKGYGGGHLQQTGYRHEHKGPAGALPPGDPEFHPPTADAPGFYRFKGDGYVMVHGGTAFAGAATYELMLRVQSYHPAGILGTCGSQVNLKMLETGQLQASQREATVTTTEPVPLDFWQRVAVVYDHRELCLYLNGELQGRAPCQPRLTETMNVVVIGGGCRFPYHPVNLLKGDLRDIRFYGRDLRPEEFLSSQKE